MKDKKEDLKFKLDQAKYFLNLMKDAKRPDLHYLASAFSNTAYTVYQYLRAIDKQLYLRLKTVDELKPFILDGSEGGIRGLDVHSGQPLKVVRRWVSGPNAQRITRSSDQLSEEEKEVLRRIGVTNFDNILFPEPVILSEKDATFFVRFGRTERDLFPLCESALNILQAEIASIPD